MSPDELKKKADALDRQAEKALAKGQKQKALELFAQAEVLLQIATRRGLQVGDGGRTIRTMQNPVPAEVRSGQGRARRRHPAQELLYKAGITITDLADILGEKRARVSAWMASSEKSKRTGESALRPIPGHIADRLDAGVTLPNGRTLVIPRSAWQRIAE